MSHCRLVFTSRSPVGCGPSPWLTGRDQPLWAQDQAHHPLTPLTLILCCPQEASSRNLVTLRVDPEGFFLYWTGPNMVRTVLVLPAQA